MTKTGFYCSIVKYCICASVSLILIQFEPMEECIKYTFLLTYEFLTIKYTNTVMHTRLGAS
jgi:hypothetical protein